MSLVVEVYKLTDLLPKSEEFGLKSQLRRTAISIPSNIAEGCGRNSSKEMTQFLAIASGSSTELETQLEIGVAIGYFDLPDGMLERVVQVRKMLYGLQHAMKFKVTKN